MLTESPSGLNKVVTSLKVAALLTVLGAVVLAAERLVPDVAPGAPAAAMAGPVSQSPPDSGVQPAATDYLPARFPAPSGPVAEQPPTF